MVYAVGCYLLVGFRCCPFASYNKIPILGNTVVAAVSFVCRLVWAAVEVYSKIEKKYFTKARERAYYRLYPERKDKNYFWLQLLLPLGLFLINLGIAIGFSLCINEREEW